ncbi:MAG: FAD-binding oxidoreductase [Myxococcota bacterium]
MHELSKRIRGAVIESPPDVYATDYGGIDRVNPRLVVVAEDIADVQHTVAYARRQGLRVAVRGHGCSSTGLCLSDGVVLDMTALRRFTLGSSDTVCADAGVRWTPLQEELIERGRSCIVLGDSPAATVGGFLSVGGFGSSSVICGPAINHVTGLDIVDGKGELVHAAPGGEHDQLFHYALAGLGQTGIIVRAHFRVREHKPYWAMRARSFPEHTTVDQINAFLAQARPFEHCVVTFDIRVRKWQLLWASEHAQRPNTQGAPWLAAAVFGLAHRAIPAIGYPAIAGETIAQTRGLQRMLQGSVAGSEQREKMMHYFEDALERAPRGIALQCAHRFMNQSAEAVVQSNIEASIRAGRVTEGSQLRNIWNDFMMPSDRAEEFFRMFRKLFDDPVSTRGYFGMLLFNDGGEHSRLPLSPVPDAPMVNAISNYQMVPPSMVDDQHRRLDEAREACLEAGGRVYLYGYHPKELGFYRRQFGEEVVARWQQTKERYDPGNILGAPIFA